MVRLILLLTLLVPFTAHPDAELERLSDIADHGFRPVLRPLNDPPFFHGKLVTITGESLASGWVANQQCHRHFSHVRQLEIVFPTDRIRGLHITHSSNIGGTRVDGAVIELSDLDGESSLCLRSENRLLEADHKGYRLRVGPFFYRFLDGYFPVDVDLKVTFPAHLLTVRQVTPAVAPGVEVFVSDGTVHFSSRFEGTLWVEILFEASRS